MRADLAGDELAPLGVGLRVDEHVDVVARELHEARAGPHLLEEGLPLASGESSNAVRGFIGWWKPWIDVLSTSRSSSKSARSCACSSAVIGRLLSGVHQLAVRWYTVSDATSSTMVGTTCTPLDEVPTTATRLPAKSTGSAGHRPVWCCTPPEVVAPGHVGEVRHRQHAGGGDEEPGPRCRRCPSSASPSQVPDGSSKTAAVTAGAEAHVAAQVEAVDHVVEVALDLGLAGEVLLPLPLVEELLREEVAVRVALGVEPGAGVAVPEPGAADAVARLDQLRREAGLAAGRAGRSR